MLWPLHLPENSHEHPSEIPVSSPRGCRHCRRRGAPSSNGCCGSVRTCHGGLTAGLPRPGRILLAVSFGQQRLWFMAQLDPASSVYNTVSSISLATPVDVEALQGAVDALVARHESLRTTFEAVDGEPFQRVNAHAPVVVEVGLPTPEFVRRPFDLERGPLVRVCVTVDTGQVVACVHHIVTDGWSMGIFLRELSVVVHGGTRRKVLAALAPLPIQYCGFCRVATRGTLRAPVIGAAEFLASRVGGSAGAGSGHRSSAPGDALLPRGDSPGADLAGDRGAACGDWRGTGRHFVYGGAGRFLCAAWAATAAKTKW